jgi:hypothetical protein
MGRLLAEELGMSEPHVVSALIAKRGELAGQTEHHQTVLRQLIIDLDHLDATLRIFVPDIDLEDIRPKPFPPQAAAFKGEVARIILGTLREAGKPLTTAELTVYVMAARGLNTADKRLLKTMSKRVGSALRHHRSVGLLRSVQKAGQLTGWEVAQ